MSSGKMALMRHVADTVYTGLRGHTDPDSPELCLLVLPQVRKRDWVNYAAWSQEALMRAVAELPELQDLAISGAMCGREIGRLAGAKQLTRLELVTACESSLSTCLCSGGQQSRGRKNTHRRCRFCGTTG